MMIKEQLLLFVSMLLPSVAMADAVEIDGIYYNLTSETKKAEVTSNPSKYTDAITIPTSVICNDITYNVTNIGIQAFDGCSALTSVTIPNSVTSIGSHAFRGCSGLTSVIIPNSVTSIGMSTFYDCSGLTSVIIPNSVTSIDNAAFSGCTGLTSINVNSGNTKYDSRDNCNAIIETSSNTLIAGCKSTIIPNSVTSIGKYAFNRCSSLTSIIIPNSVTNIDNHAFSGCRGLTSIEIPNSVTSIGSYALDGCRGLTSIEIPNSVTSIGTVAFQNCSSLISIEIGNGIKSIGRYAFNKCSKLTNVYCHAESVPTTESDAFEGVNIGNVTLHVPASSVNIYKTTAPWSSFKSVIETLEKCATPTISYKDGELTFNCETEGVKYVSTITAPESSGPDGKEIDLSKSFRVSVYATKDGYQDSDIATQNVDVRGLKGDVNGDGDVTAQDASLILQKVAGKIE